MSDDSNIFKKSTSTDYDCYFIRSDYISIYPSAYRDSKYDIKAKINLEDNIIASAKQLKRNYILRWDNPTPAASTTISTLYCILGGYFFILKISLNDLPASYTFLTIKLNTSLKVKENVYTTVLDSLTGEGSHTQLDSGGTPSYFYGVVFANKDLTGTSPNIYSLNLTSPASYFGLAAADILSGLQNIYDSRSIATNLVNGIAASDDSDKNYFNDTSITNIYYYNNKDTVTANELDRTKYSLLFGETVSIKGTNDNIAGYDFVLGKENYITNAGSFDTLLGQYLKSQYSDQFIIGKYNSNKENNIFEIGWGSAAGGRKNIFEIDNSGDVTAVGKLTIGADVPANKALTNVVLDVKQGSINVYGGCNFGGELKINGENGLTIANAIGNTVTIVNSGKAYLATSLDIGDRDDESLGRALFVKGKAGITGTLEVNDKSNLQGEVSIDATKLNLYKNTTSGTYDTIFEYNTTNKCLEIKVM